jgi:hypothetical protein
LQSWEATAPRLYSIVTGFFPETSPKAAWKDNPRPLLVCGTAVDPDTNMIFCRIAYGTTKKFGKGHISDLEIGNVSILNYLGLKRPTTFVIHSGTQMVIMPWISEFFQPWSGYHSPTLSRLPEDMQKHVGHVLARLTDLPEF